jgi:hypothetical protein
VTPEPVMITSSVACPQCRATLQVPPGVAAGGKTRCPRCGTIVVVPYTNALQVAAAPAQAGPPPLPPRTGRQSSFLRPLLVLAAIFVGFVVVLGATAVLVAICFLGESREPDPTGDPAEGAPALSTTTKQPVKKKASPPPPLIVLSPENQQKADLVTKRGVEYLKSRQVDSGNEQGSWPGGSGAGYTALAGLTLLECDVPAADPVVQQAAANVRSRLARNAGADKEVYHVAVGLLFLMRLNDPADRDLIQSLALRLVANQLPSGGWVYSCRPLSMKQEQAVLGYLKERAAGGQAGAVPVDMGQLPLGVLQTPSENTREFYRPGDNSCTQFALLALWNARRYDLPLDPVLERVALHFRHSQRPDGSWSYNPTFGYNPSPLPTMTCAGLLGLAVGYGLDNDAKAGSKLNEDEAIRKALQVVGQAMDNWSVQLKSAPEMYFLWSVERVAVLYQLAKIEDKEWYLWGLELLHQHQQAEGSWHTHAGPGSSKLTDTCFALLFLQRANLAKDLTDKLQEMMAVLRAAPRKG